MTNDEHPSAEESRAGCVAICGRPNVGKSSLLNCLVGEKVAIVSPKPQTTRDRILGVAEHGHAQMVFLDTPGIHDAKQRLNEFMVEQARAAAHEADLVLFMVDASEPPTQADQIGARLVASLDKPVIMTLNKIDTLAPPQVQPVIDEFKNLGNFEHGVAISATTGINLNVLLDTIAEMLPPGPWLYPEGTATDAPIKFSIAELIREQILALTDEEIPYSVAVMVEEMEERNEEMTYVRAVVYVERDSQKGIVIGHKGAMLKEIGKRARPEIEELLGTRVYLDLWVKVLKHWRKKEHLLKRMGYAVKERPT